MPALRLHLPPNLAAASARDAVALRIELDPGAPEPGLVPALALLQGWCGTERPPAFIQLSRRQLRELAAAADGMPVFYEGARPVQWAHDELLADPVVPNSAPAPTPAARAA